MEEREHATSTRRTFLKLVGAAAVAPAVVRARSLMPIWVPRQRQILLATGWAVATPDEWEYAQGEFQPIIICEDGHHYRVGRGEYTRVGERVEFSLRMDCAARPLRVIGLPGWHQTTLSSYLVDAIRMGA